MSENVHKEVAVTEQYERQCLLSATNPVFV